MSQQRQERPRNEQVSRDSHMHLIKYVIGLGIGVIPLAFFLLASGSLAGQFTIYVFFLALLSYLGLLAAAIVCLTMRGSRSVGYGMVTMLVLTPVIVNKSGLPDFR